jgi:hypothetical protein
MKPIAAAALVVFALLPMAAQAAMQCFADRRVVQVSTGYVEGSLGADGGDAVYFKLDNGKMYPLNNGFNLDWPRGQALHRTLLLAMTARYRVTGYDHYGYGGTCDDIDEIVLQP